MSQRATLPELDSWMFEAFVDAGLADTGTYRRRASRSSSDGTPCKVLIDRAVQFVGDFSEASAPLVTATFLLAELGNPPEIGDTVTIGDETFALERPVAIDESRAQFVVRPT